MWKKKETFKQSWKRKSNVQAMQMKRPLRPGYQTRGTLGIREMEVITQAAHRRPATQARHGCDL